jgi:hypothetical protein
MFFCLESYIGPDAILRVQGILWQLCITFCTNFRKNETETLARITQASGEESKSHTWKSKLMKTEKGETSEEQSQDHAHNFLWHRTYMHTHGKGLLQGWWWLAGPKLVSDQMAAPVPEIIDDSWCILGESAASIFRTGRHSTALNIKAAHFSLSVP